MEGGLSQNIHNADGYDLYEIKGPMGKGLRISNSGTHIAITGGTGCLVFLDLAAHLLRKKLKLLSKEEDLLLDTDTFKFILYVSF
jgi:NAD(P)H-flavin reductase